MARSKPSTRIGEAERSAAQRALQEHLNAGRLQVTEYAERSARAAEAVTAAEIAELFTDLPGRPPKMAGAPAGGAGRTLAIGGGLVVVVALVGLVAFVAGRSGTPAPAVVAAPTASASPGTPADLAPTESSVPTPDTQSAETPTAETPTGSAEALPDGGTVRRTTGADAITLRPEYGVDLDDLTSPNWDVGVGCCARDVGFASDASQVYLSDDYAVMTGSPGYAACSHETGYTRGALERGSLQSGEELCLRTNGDRYALVTVVGVTDQAFQFRATVWDPPISS